MVFLPFKTHRWRLLVILCLECSRKTGDRQHCSACALHVGGRQHARKHGDVTPPQIRNNGTIVRQGQALKGLNEAIKVLAFSSVVHTRMQLGDADHRDRQCLLTPLQETNRLLLAAQVVD
ncbi:MAG: hypothetical protein WBN89_09885 [Prochlorococcaceae cyanobacterium]